MPLALLEDLYFARAAAGWTFEASDNAPSKNNLVPCPEHCTMFSGCSTTLSLELCKRSSTSQKAVSTSTACFISGNRYYCTLGNLSYNEHIGVEEAATTGFR